MYAQPVSYVWSMLASEAPSHMYLSVDQEHPSWRLGICHEEGVMPSLPIHVQSQCAYH